MEDLAMRAAVPLLAVCALVAGCAAGTEPINPTPPSVSYQVPGNNVAATNAEAQNYCLQYGHAAQFRGVNTGDLAVYTCDGAPVSGVAAVPPSYGYGSSVPPAEPYAAPVQCADALHQDRPGGTDYHGPPVAGCPYR
jgi:hypothetical protein